MDFERAHIIGNGLAGLSTAFYLLHEKCLPPENIFIYDNVHFDGGSLDAFSPDHAANPAGQGKYFMRGFRMLEENVYSAVFDLMSKVPLIEQPDKTLLDDFINFNSVVQTKSYSRLVQNGKAINSRKFTLKLSDSIKILTLLATPESKLQKVTVEDWFSPQFFESNFWAEFATTFSFQPWHSAEEMKRYILRFIQCAPVLDTQTCIRSTRYNQYESIAKPIIHFLKNKGVNFIYNAAVTDIDFQKDPSSGKLMVKTLHLLRDNAESEINAGQKDAVFISPGSMTASYSIGSMDKAPAVKKASMADSVDWKLWQKISKVSPEFGHPEVFGSDTEKSRWVSFTITLNKSIFVKLLEEITKTKAGLEGPVTIKDSNWLIAFALPYSPHFKDQPQDVQLVWGYGMFSDRPGNYIKKPMAECSGREILQELIYHLRFQHLEKEILASAECIPCMLPFITSQFMPRSFGDRPKVVPQCAGNFAFIGQYCDIPLDIVFTLEYSVRSAQTAVYTMLGTPEKVTPIYKGWKRLKYLFGAFRTVFR